ncbi:unnamed protein product [Ambrosiozyma monospora]|uniref:Unnamed protein product n=1 Tax=Ambrosiozyma monospora TaxID=43982 RepID=A0A9W6YXA8_AMBMO|nr:unnamed protein product [Ambrosiozyma monospora]
MSTFTFTWPSGPKDVIVTGTFDDWSKTLPLVKQADGSFELTVPFPKDQEKILFKFVVDGEWATSKTYKHEPDTSGHLNNVLTPQDFVSTKSNSSASKIPEAGGLAVPVTEISSKQSPSTLDPQSRTLDPKKSLDPNPELSTSVLPSSEGKQTTLGEPGVVIPKDPHSVSAFNEVRDVDAKALNEETEPIIGSGVPTTTTAAPATSSTEEPILSTTVLPTSEGKQTTLGEAGAVIPKDAHSVSAFNEVRDVDAKALNDESEPIVGTGIPNTKTAADTTPVPTASSAIENKDVKQEVKKPATERIAVYGESTTEPDVSTTVMPTSEGKQGTLGEPGAVIPNDPHSVSAFNEVRDVDAKALNEESEPVVGTGAPATATAAGVGATAIGAAAVGAATLTSKSKKQEPEVSTTVLPTSEGKQTTLGEAGVAIPKDPHSVSAFSEVRDVDAKALNEESEPVVGTGATSAPAAAVATSAKEPELSTTVLPSSEGKQATLGEPGVVIPKDPHSISAFNEVRDVDAKALNEESEPIVGTGAPATTAATTSAAPASKEPELSTTVLPTSEGKQTTLGEAGAAIPKDPQSISAFNEVRDVDAKALNEESEPIVGSGAPTSAESSSAAPAKATTTEPAVSAAVLPTSEGKQTTLGEAGAAVPENPQSVPELGQVRDVDAKALNDTAEPIVGTGEPTEVPVGAGSKTVEPKSSEAPTSNDATPLATETPATEEVSAVAGAGTATASQSESEEKKTKYVKKVVKKVKKEKTSESPNTAESAPIQASETVPETPSVPAAQSAPVASKPATTETPKKEKKRGFLSKLKRLLH